MELYQIKLLVMIGLGISSIVVGLLPAWFTLRGRQKCPLFLSLLICLGGGVLMATSLIHMLPEVRETLTSHQQYAEFILCAGFFLVYVIDELVHFVYSGSHNHTAHDHTHVPVTPPNRSPGSYQAPPTYGATEYQPLFRENTRSPPYNPNYSGVLLMQEQDTNSEPAPSQLCHVGHQEPCNASPIGNVGLLLALSVHAILEGLAVGLQTSETKILLLLTAIASHKLVIGFCLGLELASALTSLCRHFVCVAVFSLGSVLGIGIGMIIHKIPKQMLEIVFPILQGLAAGTLLYIAVSEVLPRERARWHKHHHRRIAGILQYLFVIGGFISMVAIKIFLDDHN